MESISTTAVPRKFGFDADFKADNHDKNQHDQQQMLQAAIDDEKAAGRLFDATQLQTAVSRAEQQAYEAGQAAALEGQNQQLLNVWQQALAQLSVLLDNDNKREQQSQQMALSSLLLAIKKTFPILAEKTAQLQVASVLAEVFEHQSQEARLVVRVADNMLDAVVAQVETLKQQQAFMGKVVVLADSGLAIGDCRVEWADGGLEHLQKNIQHGLEAAIIRVLQHISQPILTPTHEANKHDH